MIIWDTLNNPSICVHRKLDHPTTDEDYQYYKGKEYAPDKITRKRRSDGWGSYIECILSTPWPIRFHMSLQVPDKALIRYLGKFPETPYNTN